MTHDFTLIFREFWQEGGVKLSINWCKKCGMVKTGPCSEPGAYNYYVYNIAGHQTPVESKEDPPCINP